METLKTKLLILCLFGLIALPAAAQAPELAPRSISENPLMDGTKLPVEAGWSITMDDQALGTASLTKSGEIRIKCNQGETYRISANPSTESNFSPINDYTIEFRVKIPQNNGRGLDLMIRDGVGSSKLLVFSHNRVMINGLKEAITQINNKEYHTYRVAVERANKKLHLYIDGKYTTTLEMERRGGTPSLLFAKGNVNSATEIMIDYLTFDLTGAYAPENK